MRSLPAAPQVGFLTLFPVPPIGSTAAAGRTVLAESSWRASKTSADWNENFCNKRRTARLGTDLRLRFTESSPLKTARPVRIRNRPPSRRPFDERAQSAHPHCSGRLRRAKARIKTARGIGWRRMARGGRRIEGLDRNPGKSEWIASPRNLHTNAAPPRWSAGLSHVQSQTGRC
jgi:hypothetical protein